MESNDEVESYTHAVDRDNTMDGFSDIEDAVSNYSYDEGINDVHQPPALTSEAMVDGTKDVMDDILWSDCPEELYLQRILEERQKQSTPPQLGDEEMTFQDSIMGQSTIDVAGVLMDHPRPHIAPSPSASNDDGRSWTKFAPIAASVTTDDGGGVGAANQSISTEDDPVSFMESLDSTSGSWVVKQPPTTEETASPTSPPEIRKSHRNINPRVLNFDNLEAPAPAPARPTTRTWRELEIPQTVDLKNADEEATTQGNHTIGMSTLSGDTGLRNISQPDGDYTRWWTDVENVTYTKPEHGTPTTGSSTRHNKQNSAPPTPSTQASGQTKSDRNKNIPGGEGFFSRLVRTLTEDEKVFRRTVVVSVVFITIFVSLAAVALIRSKGLQSSSQRSQEIPPSNISSDFGQPATNPTVLNPTTEPRTQSSATQAPTSTFDSEVQDPEGTEAPIIAETQDVDYFRKVYNLIYRQSPESMQSLDDKQSPQYRALRWSTDDLPNFPTLSDERILQRWALVVLYYSTLGETWDDQTGWLTASDECRWYSSSDESQCNEQGILKLLDLRGNNLQGSLPSELLVFSGTLGRLYVNNNALSGIIPTSISRLSSVQRLHLTSNQFSGSIPSEVGRMISLEHLSLARNQLNGSIPVELSEVENLRFLDLAENQITGIIPTQLGDLSDLEYISLSDNRISGTVPTEFGTLGSLGFLDLSINDFTGAVPVGVCAKRTEGLIVLQLDCGEVSCSCCDCS